MNTTALSRIAGMDLSALSGPWLLAEDRIKQIHAKVAAVASGAVTPPQMSHGEDHGADDEPGYDLVGGVAVIKVIGVMTKYPLMSAWMDEWCGFCPAVPIMSALNEAMADDRVKEIAFIIDSPGGMVAGTNELAEAIAVADKGKPCHAIVSDLAASGGYYIASQCRSITCNAMGEVGCIGVYTVLADVSKWYAEMGVELTVVSSGGVKGLGADGKVSEELVADQQRGVDAMYAKFVGDVARGREHAGMTFEQAKQVATGQTWLAQQALGLKLIDSVASSADALTLISNNLSGSLSPAVSPAPQAGKLSAVSDGVRNPMDPKKRAYLESIGLRTDATDDQAQQFYDLLNEEKRAEADAAVDAEEEVVVEETLAGSGGNDKVVTGKTSLGDIVKACEGDKSAAADFYLAGMTTDQATAAYVAVKAAKNDAA